VSEFDLIFVGGGLASCLAALALLERRPDVRLAIVEREAQLGGNHTWCFHAADVSARARTVVEPLVVARWPGYAVQFPRRTRRVASPYACIKSERLHEITSARVARSRASELRLSARATQVEATHVELSDGEVLRAPLVIDARGPLEQTSETRDTPQHRGYQKFVGLELQVEPNHTLTEPILFDARVPQRDGFRFMYLLPLALDRVLIEETFFSDRSQLDIPSSRSAILAYAQAHGFVVRELVRVEHGVLPMPWRDPPFDLARRPLCAGYRAGLFHPVTGYSFPLAIGFALALAESDLRHLERSPLADYIAAQSAQRPFLHLLTRMLFTCFAPAQRFSVLEHFYRLPESLIERFYAAELTTLDRARILFGAPPAGFSVTRALRLQIGTAHETSSAR
jgi:lycopene beta-cyclase